MTLGFKESVRIDVLSPQLVLGLIAIHSVFESHGYDCILTSVSDGAHRSGSRHYDGNACDLRIRHISSGSHVTDLVDDLRRVLGSNFDVVLEVDHIHVEYDPK